MQNPLQRPALGARLLLDGRHVAQLRAYLAVLDDRVLQLHQAPRVRQVRQAAALLLTLRPDQPEAPCYAKSPTSSQNCHTTLNGHILQLPGSSCLSCALC